MLEVPSVPQVRQERTQGKFQDGEWYCDCKPPRKSVLLQVQKDNENKGKWFRKCAKPQGQQCTFWLWEHVAEALEKKAREREAQESAAAEREAHSSTYPLYSRLASTVESEPLLSPDVGMTPMPRQRIFRGIPRMTGAGTQSGGLGSGWDSEDSDLTEQGANQARMGRLQPSLFENQTLAAPNPNGNRPVAANVGAGTSFGNLSGVTVVLDDSDTDEVMEAPGPAQRPAQAQRNEAPVTPSRRATFMGPDGLPTPQPSRNTLLIASGSMSKKRKIAPGMSIPSPKTPTRTRNALGSWEEPTADDSQDDRERDWHLLVEEVRVIREDLRLVRERRRMDREKIQGLRQELRVQSNRMAELEALVVSLQAGKSTGAPQNPFQDTADG
ncbi:DNA topoisomerase 3-alpha [Madurella mycetomatis]|uniref:DNA topoisomerase 3-alpha n=1 Tax=Madurella mycetomatis TaxID=100816 RepID=A0A175W8K4_9PEZI|nr:DNA topoisomerase 3-alpha [Madurella mycetomatis]